MSTRILFFGIFAFAMLCFITGCDNDDDNQAPMPPPEEPMVCMRDDYVGTFAGIEMCEVGEPQEADPKYIITEGPEPNLAIVNGGDIENQIVTVDGCEFEVNVSVFNNSVKTIISLANDTLRVHNEIIFGGILTSDCMFEGVRQ